MADDNRNDISGKVGLDTTNFKTGIADLNRQIRVIDSGFKAAAAGMDDWSKSADGIGERVDSLIKITELQKKKVAALTEEYQRVAKEEGESSKAAQDLQVRINKETQALNANQKELADNTQKLQDFGEESDDAGKKTSSFTEKLKTIGGGVASTAIKSVAAIGASAVGAAAGLFKIAQNAGEAADEVLTMASQTGLSAQKIQELRYASEFVDVSLETMTGAMAKNIKSMTTAAKGTGDAAAAYRRLKVDVTDANGKLRDSQTVYNEALEALGNVSDETERDSLAMQIFGKSAQDLNPLIKAGADELARLSDEAHKMGAVLSDEALASAGKFDDTMQQLKLSGQGLVSSIGVAVIPAISGIVSSVVNVVPKITEAIKTGNWSEAVNAIAGTLSSLINKFSAMLPGLLSGLISLVSQLVTALVQNIPVILPTLINGVLQILDALIQIITDNADMLIDAAIQAVLQLAFGLIKAIPKLIPAAIAIITGLANGLIENLPMLIEELPKLVEAIVQGIVDNLPLLIDAAIQITVSLAGALIENLPLLIEAVIKIAGSLVKAFIAGWGQIFEFIPKLFTSIREKFGSIDWGQLGKNLIDGIVKGIVGAAKNIGNAVKDAAMSALNTAKKVLGIHSPSTVAEKMIGNNFGLGIAKGIEGTTKDVNKAMAGLSKQLVTEGEININSSVKSSASKGSTSRGSLGPISVVIEKFVNNDTDKDMQTLADILMEKIDKKRERMEAVWE